jgi:aryl-alcohol dehydrogenase-like predicted oxidoreductase
LNGDAQMMPEAILNAVLNGTGVSMVLASMLKPKHLAANVRALEQCRFSAAELEELRQRLG